MEQGIQLLNRSMQLFKTSPKLAPMDAAYRITRRVGTRESLGITLQCPFLLQSSHPVNR